MKNTTGITIYRVLRVTICTCVICIVFYLYLPSKSNIINNMTATVGENHVDILCVGSSHVDTGLNPIQMYRDYGYATYILGCGAMSPWQCYYNIKHACEKQHPSLIICDAYMMGISQDYRDYFDSNTVENTLNMPFSPDKISTVLRSNADRKLDVILRFPYIHNDYDEFYGFTASKFIGVDNNSLGYSLDQNVEAYTGEPYDVITNEIEPLSDQNELYLKKIIEFCKYNGMDLILVNSPSLIVNEESQKYYNYIAMIASDNDVMFIDGNLYQDEIGIDWCTDTGDGGHHLNHDGVTKFTKFMAMIIHDNYDIPDRRDRIDYENFKKGIMWLEEQKN